MSELASSNLETIWALDRSGNRKMAIRLCDTFLAQIRVCNVDKVHYAVARSTLHILDNNLEAYEEDIKLLEELRRKETQCEDEFSLFYS